MYTGAKTLRVAAYAVVTFSEGIITGRKRKISKAETRSEVDIEDLAFIFLPPRN
jgi:hypothetical protein